MGRRVSRNARQERALRITRLQSAIAELESHKNFFLSQGELAPEGAWVARYQVKQPKKVYWYYKLQADKPTFTKSTKTQSLSKYKHLGKAGTQDHIDSVMAVVRRTIVSELQKTIDSLKRSLIDVSFDGEQEDI